MRDRTLDLTAIGPAVRAGSARVVRMRIAAEGVVEKGGRFRFAGWPDACAIEGEPPPEGHRSIRANVHFRDGAPRLRLLDG